MTDHDPVDDYDIESGVFPAELLQAERWFVWALDDGRKIPRAPWVDDNTEETFVSAYDPDVWVDFDTADQWVETVSQYGHASCIPPIEDNSRERLVFFDFDDVRDPDTGEIHGQAWAFIDKYDLPAWLSTSGSGIHAFAWGSIPEGFKVSFERDLDAWKGHDDPHLEVYGGQRFMALTGEHISQTPVSAADMGSTLDDIFARYGSERNTGVEREPDISRADVADLDTTEDVQDIYDAIAHVRPADIQLRSTVTEDRGDVVSLNPSWEQSQSGTRIGQFDDHWLYRKGNHRLDALQIVALEERIISDPTDYPSGQAFVEAVDELRDRGADIPELVSSGPSLDVVDRGPSPDGACSGGGGSGTAAETDGGAVAEDGDDDAPALSEKERFRDRVHDVLIALDDDEINSRTARHRIAMAFLDAFDFVHPEESVRGWLARLYVYNPDEGIYEPRGEQFIEKELERAAGDYVTNQITNEIVGKIERLSIERGDQFTTAPHRLVVANGILNLHTGELDNWTPHEYHRTKLDVRWNPDVGEPEAIDEFFNDIVSSRDVGTLYRLVAHTLYKEYVGEKAAMLVGGGQNGKSVFLDLCERFLGEFNVSHRALQDFDDDQFSANQLQGKLANIHPDMGDKAVKDMSTFKKLTGRDTMTADVKYETPITFENHATLLFAANEMPRFGEDNHAIWRRWVYVNFPNTFKEDDPEAKDPVPKRTLMRRLTQPDELQALLVRCQKEIQRWYEGEAWYPDAMSPQEVREQMKKAAEPVYDFASVALADVGDGDVWVRKDNVRKAYREYATQEGLPKLGKQQFGEELINLIDYSIESARPRVDGNRPHVYKGVCWTERGRQLAGLDEPDEDDQQQVQDSGQKTARVLEIVKELVEQNDNQPVSQDMVIGHAMGEMGMTTAENALERLKDQGDVYSPERGEVLPT